MIFLGAHPPLRAWALKKRGHTLTTELRSNMLLSSHLSDYLCAYMSAHIRNCKYELHSKMPALQRLARSEALYQAHYEALYVQKTMRQPTPRMAGHIPRKPWGVKCPGMGWLQQCIILRQATSFVRSFLHLL